MGWSFCFCEAIVTRLLMIDNYDSFTFNLVQMFRCFALTLEVHRSDRITVAQVRAMAPDYIVISPGPKDPSHAGISMSLIAAMHAGTPILGVCLGMQCINEVFAGRTVRSPQPLHGKTSLVFHDGGFLFSGLPSPFKAARYHSLVVEPAAAALEKDLIVTAWSDSGLIMGLSHRRFPLHGVQFHPESFLTEHGFVLIENFLRLGPLEVEHAHRPSKTH
jgi:anthranilate synthase/aminodeoxychorismate synthase-like glutamine amidotransferase